MQIGDQAQTGGMLNRLVCRAVFAKANGVMCEHMHNALLHERRHADGVAGIIGKSKEGTAKGQITTMQCHAIHDGRHTELAHTVVDVSAKLHPFVGGTHRHHPLPIGEVGTGKVGRAAQHLGQQRRKSGNHKLRGFPTGNRFRAFCSGFNKRRRLIRKVGG